MATKFYTTSEAAAAIGVSRQTLQTWIASGKVSAPKVVGNTRIWSESQVNKLRRLDYRGKKKGKR